MNVRTIATTAAVLMLSAQAVFAAQVVGYNKANVPANTDVRMSVPFTLHAEGTFTVSSVTGSGVTVTDTLVTGAYANAYYVRFISGNASGLWSTISNNGANSVDIADAQVKALVGNGDSFRIYKHQTLGSVFPKGLLGTSFVNGTKVLFYDNNLAAMSQNKAAVKTATFNAASGNWLGAGVTNNTVMTPETQFILRNIGGQTLTLLTLGDAADYSVSRLIAPNGDLVIGTGYPVPVVLKDAGLNGTLRKVLFFDNNAVGQNKAAVKTATFNVGSGTWLGAGVTGNELIKGSDSLTVRLPAAEAGTKVTITKPY